MRPKRLNREDQAPIVVVAAARVGWPLRDRVDREDRIRPEDDAGQAGAARALPPRDTRARERRVRRHPEQYFGLHRRGKHRPAATEGKQAA